jgi:hypothetical protein
VNHWLWQSGLFEEFRNKAEGHYAQTGADYLLDLDFQEAYLEKVVDWYVYYLGEIPSAPQNRKDSRALYGALFSASQSGVGRRILIVNRAKQDAIRSSCQLVKQYETGGNKNVMINKL